MDSGRTYKTIVATVAALIIAIGAMGQYDLNQFFMRGRQMLIDGKYSSAIDNFSMLIRLDTTSYDGYLMRGIAKYNLGDYMGAQEDFDNSLRLNPIYTPAYHYRAITLSRTGKYEEALKDLQEAIDLRPSYDGLFFSRGVTYFLSQQFEKAISDFNRFIAKVPKESDAYLNRGACYLYLKDTVSALKDYNIAINLNMFDPEGFIRRSRIYAMQGQKELALEDLDQAIKLDSLNSFAYFNRALIKYDAMELGGALEDFNKVLEQDPGNALTLYNRALLESQIGDYNNALSDYDRVIAVNPENVLAYFNRGAVLLQMGMYRDALNDYTKAIELYPDFAKAYYNRSYVKNHLGQHASAKKDWDTAERKVKEYREKTADTSNLGIFADTSKKFDNLLALDADFAKKDFNNELLQNRDINIKLKPLFKFNLQEDERTIMALQTVYESKKVDSFIDGSPIPLALDARNNAGSDAVSEKELAGYEQMVRDYRSRIAGAKANASATSMAEFAMGVINGEQSMFNSALECYNKAIEEYPKQAYYFINRGVLQAEMIDFISSMESNVQILSLDNTRTARARVQEQSYKKYDYSASIADMKNALSIEPGFPFAYYNLGNLFCLSGDLPEAINQYSKAIKAFNNFAEAYFNRGLVLIYLKDKQKGCIDLSKAGELGVKDAYPTIKKYCTKE